MTTSEKDFECFSGYFEGIEVALRKGKEVLEICCVIQFANEALGGTLYQDLPLQHPTKTEHHQRSLYDVPVHKMKIISGMPLHDLLEKDTLGVNSYHH